MFITLNELRYITALAQEKHFGNAAKKCFVSQPSLSIAIKKLEENLRVQLFERNKNHVLITQSGLPIINKARQILDAVEQFEHLAYTSANPANVELRVGAIHTVGPYLFPQLIQKLHQENSNKLKLIIEEGFTKDLTTKLLDGGLDVIIVAKPFNHPNINTIELYNETLDVIITPEHMWQQKKFIKPEELDGQTLLLLGNGHCFRNQVLDICTKCNIGNAEASNHILITTSIETIKYMVAGKIGISIIPHHFTHNTDKNLILVRPFNDPQPYREIILAYRSSFANTLAIEQLRNLIDSLKLSIQ